MNNNIYWGLVLGIVGGVISTVIAAKFVNTSPTGGDQPNHISARSHSARGGELIVQSPQKTPANVSPVAQNTPITEAAYNQQPHGYEPTLGPNRNKPSQEVLIPM